MRAASYDSLAGQSVPKEANCQDAEATSVPPFARFLGCGTQPNGFRMLESKDADGMQDRAVFALFESIFTGDTYVGPNRTVCRSRAV